MSSDAVRQSTRRERLTGRDGRGGAGRTAVAERLAGASRSTAPGEHGLTSRAPALSCASSTAPKNCRPGRRLRTTTSAAAAPAPRMPSTEPSMPPRRPAPRTRAPPCRAHRPLRRRARARAQRTSPGVLPRPRRRRRPVGRRRPPQRGVGAGQSRATASASASACSACRNQRASGAFTTRMPRRVASATSMAAVSSPAQPMTRRALPSASMLAVTGAPGATASASPRRGPARRPKPAPDAPRPADPRPGGARTPSGARLPAPARCESRSCVAPRSRRPA